jgi:hypothetical protein
MAALRGGEHPALSVGSIDSGSIKSFDFFGSSAIVDEISELLIAVWDRIKYAAEENFRYQIEVAMMAAGLPTLSCPRAISKVSKQSNQNHSMKI